jgi:hypothetical protein
MMLCRTAILCWLTLMLHGQNLQLLPANHVVALKLQTLPASVQIYTCDGTKWTGPVPDAIAVNGDHTVIVHHYKGPTWEATDGSTIHGTNPKPTPSPKANSVPWLVLSGEGGTGRFAKVDIIHRIDTDGGVAPTDPCDAAHNQQQVRVPYKATYILYAPHDESK